MILLLCNKKQNGWHVIDENIKYIFSFSCVASNQCEGEGLLDVRGTGEYTCEDTSQICCHQSLLKEQQSLDEIITEDEEETLEDFDYYEEDVPCSSLAKDGYRYSNKQSK